jgi:hypothetical protein
MLFFSFLKISKFTTNKEKYRPSSPKPACDLLPPRVAQHIKNCDTSRNTKRTKKSAFSIGRASRKHTANLDSCTEINKATNHDAST